MKSAVWFVVRCQIRKKTPIMTLATIKVLLSHLIRMPPGIGQTISNPLHRNVSLLPFHCLYRIYHGEETVSRWNKDAIIKNKNALMKVYREKQMDREGRYETGGRTCTFPERRHRRLWSKSEERLVNTSISWMSGDIS